MAKVVFGNISGGKACRLVTTGKKGKSSHNHDITLSKLEYVYMARYLIFEKVEMFPIIFFFFL